MTHLTHVRFQSDTPQGRAFLREHLSKASDQTGHKLLWTLFHEAPEDTRDFLFRRGEDGSFLVVSERAPKGDPAVVALRSKPYEPKLSSGQRFGFRLKVNPTVARSQPGERARSKRRDVLLEAKHERQRTDPANPLTNEEREEIALDWLQVKLARVGAELDLNHSQLLTYEQVALPKKAGRVPVQMSVVEIEGVLTVTDPAALEAALKTGIGAGKAFGLGLLLLRPLGA